MTIDIKTMASLARLHMTQSQIDQFKDDMEHIIKVVQTLPPLKGDESTLDEQCPMMLREDTVTKSMPREALLQNAPAQKAGCFLVPKVFD